MATIKFSQLPNLPLANIDAGTYAPVVDAFTNYTVTMANLTGYVNQNSSNISVTGTVSATGNITGAYILGNGSQLTGLPATYGNANVAAYLPTFTGNLAGGNANISFGINSVSISPTILSVSNGNLTTQLTKDGLYGNVTAATVTASANVTSNLFIGNGSALTNLAGANVTGTVPTANTVTTAAQANITSVGVLTSLSSTGNITGSYFFGNASQMTGITATATNAFITANANGTLLTSNTTSGVLTFSTGNNIAITGTGANNTIQIGVTGTVANAAYATLAALATTATFANTAGSAATASTATTAVTATSATTADSVTSASQPVITSVGTLTSLSVTGNVSANYYIGNGSLLTGIAGGGGGTSITNGTSSVSIPTGSGNINFTVNGNTIMTMRDLAGTGFAEIIANNAIQAYAYNLSSGGGISPGQIQVGIFESNIAAGEGTWGASELYLGLNPTSNVRIGGNLVVTTSGTKTGTSAGVRGSIIWDANYIYVCTSTNVWKRVALSSF